MELCVQVSEHFAAALYLEYSTFIASMNDRRDLQHEPEIRLYILYLYQKIQGTAAEQVVLHLSSQLSSLAGDAGCSNQNKGNCGQVSALLMQF